MAMPEQTSAANGNTMIQRSELATIKKGSMNIAFISSFHLRRAEKKALYLSALVDFRLVSGSHLL
jgi:hypothetical protein